MASRLKALTTAQLSGHLSARVRIGGYVFLMLLLAVAGAGLIGRLDWAAMLAFFYLAALVIWFALIGLALAEDTRRFFVRHAETPRGGSSPT